MKTYHFAMVEDKKGTGLVTLLKIGAVIGGAYIAYQQLNDKKKNPTGKADGTESPNAGTPGVNLGIDKAAREVGDFASRVLKAAKKIPDVLKTE